MTRKTLCSLAALLFLVPTACGGDKFEAPTGDGSGGTAGTSGGTAGQGNGGNGGNASGGSASGGAAGALSGGSGGMTSGGAGGMTSGGAGGIAGAPIVDCSGLEDGTPCEGEGDDTLCVGQLCVQSECGDGYTDEANDETCDDGKNGDDADGCTDECKSTCDVDADCDDGNACNGKETCSEKHTCELGNVVNCDDGNPCTTDSCVMGNGSCAHQSLDDGASCGSGKLCLSTSCRTSVCGDGWVDKAKGEECDDAKDGDNDDGCKDDCKFTCKTDSDCNDGNACTSDVCNTSTHTCRNTDISSTCNDGDACTADSCAPATGCVYKFIDEDGDGYSPNTCKAGGAHANKGGDCADRGTNAAAVHPGVKDYFSIDHGIPGVLAYDYDCSGSAESRYTHIYPGNCSVLINSGWLSLAPACGKSATYHNCLTGNETRTQECH
ncbi:MAG: hypothetical protein KC766_13850 [Myxococcales bacterium]|nr:hypothetical protein [Myxococcales bacterium]